MNERIRKLAEEANVRPLYSPAYAPRYIFEEEDLEKFAELIVKECAEFARQHNLEKADRSHMIHKAIKQHFGVEE